MGFKIWLPIAYVTGTDGSLSKVNGITNSLKNPLFDSGLLEGE
jgi:hypothetical protein